MFSKVASALTRGVWGQFGVDGVVRMKLWWVKVTFISIAAAEDIGCMEAGVGCRCTELASSKVTETKQGANTILLEWDQCAIFIYTVWAKAATVIGIRREVGWIVLTNLVPYVSATWWMPTVECVWSSKEKEGCSGTHTHTYSTCHKLLLEFWGNRWKFVTVFRKWLSS